MMMMMMITTAWLEAGHRIFLRVVDAFDAVLVVDAPRRVLEAATCVLQIQRYELVRRVLLQLVQSRSVQPAYTIEHAN